MKKMFIGVICFIFFLSILPITQAASTKSIQVFVDGQLLALDPPAYSEKGTTMVPFRPIFAKLGLEIGWDNSKRKVTGTKTGLEIFFTVGDSKAYVNGQEKSIPVSTRIVNNTVFVPLRFVSEATGNDIRYHEPSNSVHITTNPAAGEQPAQSNASTVDIRIQSNSLTQISNNNSYFQTLQSDTGLHFTIMPRIIKLKELWPDPAKHGDIIEMSYGFDSFIEGPDTAVIRAKIQEGIFWDLTEKLKKYPHLMQYPAAAFQNIKMEDGRIYGIPKPDALSGRLVQYVRKDWLDKLNLPVPRTMDELYNTAKAFATSDPDGNGTKDTYGLLDIQLGKGTEFYWIYDTFNESNGRFKADNGKVVDTLMQKGTRDALIWLRNAYAEGIIPRNYDSMFQSTRSNMIDQIGLFNHNITFSANPLKDMRAKQPNAELVAIPYWEGPSGKKVAPQEMGYKSVWMIPKAVEEAKVDRILAFADYLASDEGQKWRTQLMSQIPQTNTAGGYTFAESHYDDAIFELLKFLDMHYDKYEYAYSPGMTEKQNELAKNIVDQIDAAGISDVAIGLYSKYRASVEDKYNFAIQNMQYSIIKGKSDLKNWDALLEEISRDPEYQAMMKDFNESLRKRN